MILTFQSQISTFYLSYSYCGPLSSFMLHTYVRIQPESLARTTLYMLQAAGKFKIIEPGLPQSTS